MKKIIAMLVMGVCVTGVYCQTSLSFCASVEKDGACNFGNTKFITAPDSAPNKLFLRIRGEGVPLGVSKLTFKVYMIDSAGDEKLTGEVSASIQPDWVTAWQPFFFTTGKYMVKVFSETDKLMCSEGLEFFDWKKF